MFHLLLLIIILALSTNIAHTRIAIFAGGGISDTNSEIYKTFIDLSAKVSTNPIILVCTGASSASDADANAEFYINIFTNTFGAKTVIRLPIDLNHPEGAYAQANIDLVSAAHGLYFGGGDQSRLFDLFLQNDTKSGVVDSPVLAKIRQMYENDKIVLAGTSAGTTIMQAAPMITGGRSYEALIHEPHPYIDDENPDNLSYQKEGGFGFFTLGFLDTHVGTRGRQARDVRLLHWFRSTSTNLSFGIDEDSAIVLQNDTFEVVGYSGVFIYDISEAASSSPIQNPWNLANVKVSFLTSGDKYDVRSNKVTFASYKKEIKGSERHDAPVSPAIDIFSYETPETFTNVTTNLFDCKGDQTYAFSHQTKPSV